MEGKSDDEHGEKESRMADAITLLGWHPPPGVGEAKLDLVVLSDSESDSEYARKEEVDKGMEGKSDDEHGEEDSEMAEAIALIGRQPPPGVGEAKLNLVLLSDSESDSEYAREEEVDKGMEGKSDNEHGEEDTEMADAITLLGWHPPPAVGEAKLDLVLLSDSESDSEYARKEEVDKGMEGKSDDEHGEEDSEIWTAGTLLETDEAIQEEIDALLQLESEAAELQEKLEEESLTRVRCEATLELSEKIADPDKLAAATEQEMSIYKSIVKERLVKVEEDIIDKQERLDAARISLPAIYKEIEKQTPDHFETDAWQKRAHWAGLQETSVVRSIIKEADSELEKSRPVPRLRGRSFEAGASGMLVKKFGLSASADAPVDQAWRTFDARTDADADAKIYVASTPQEAARILGPEVPAANEVDEISGLEDAAGPFDEAQKNEGENGLTNTQRGNLEKNNA